MAQKRDYPEELTAKMHAEFTIDKETEICHKVGTITEFYHTEEEQRRMCKLAGITYEDILRWKGYWETLRRNK